MGSEPCAVEQSDHRYLALAEICGQAILIESEGNLVFANRTAGELFAVENSRDLLGKKLLDLIPSLADAPVGDGAEDGSSAFKQHVLARADGVMFDVEIASAACSFQGRGSVQMVLRGTNHLALPDAVSVDGILFRDRVAGAIAAVDRNGQLPAVMILGIDNFQSVNALHGHEAGELVLQEIAGRIIQGVRKGDAIAGAGPYEYAILIEALGERELAATVAQRKLEAVSRPVPLGSAEMCLTASIGIAIFSPDVRDADELIGNANRALFAARDAGGNNYRLHSRELESEARRDAAHRSETSKRIGRLTPREHQVLDMLVAGKSSKMIAYLLGTSARTIDIHRARVMEKMKADSLASLVRMVLEHRPPKQGMRNPLERDGGTP